MREKRGYEPSEPKRIYVSMDDFKTAKAPAILETAALGPCTGIAFYDQWAKKGTVAHMIDPWQLPGDLKKLEKVIRKEYKNLATVKAYASGCGISSSVNSVEDLDEQQALQKNRQQAAAELFNRLGLKPDQITTEFQSTSYESGSIALNLETGEVTIKASHVFDDL